MKHIILILLILVGGLLNSQQVGNVYPLNHPIENVKEYSYFKDMNKILAPYVGTWKYTYKDRQITLILVKEEKILEQQYNNKMYYTDRLLGRYEIKDSTGKVLETTFHKNFQDKRWMIEGGVIEPETSKFMMVFYGGKCNLGNGLIRLSKPSNNELSWTYFPQAIIVTNETKDQCKGEVYLPIGENLIFTKQPASTSPIAPQFPQELGGNKK